MRNHIMNFKTYNLFLDDIRQPKDCLTYTHEPRYGTREWEVVRSHDEFISNVTRNWAEGKFPELVSFDHDLADEHYDPAMYHGVEAYNAKSVKFDTPTGNETAKWFVQFCIDQSIELPECLVHSMNPAGKQRIKSTLQDYERYIKRFGSN